MPTDTQDSRFTEALDHYGHRRYRDALDALDREFGPDPDAWRYWSLRGLCLSDLGLEADALDAFRRATGLHPNFPDFYNAGNALLATGDPEAALAEFDRSIELNNRYPQAWVNRGIALTRLGRVDAARSSFDRAVALDPQLPQAWRSRAFLRRDNGDPGGAADDLAQVTKLVSDSASAWFELGDALGELPADRHIDQQPGGRLWRAVAAYTRAIRLAPDDPAAWAGKAIALERLANAAQATERGSAVTGMPSPVNFAAVYGEWLDHLVAAVERFPDDRWFAGCLEDARDLVG